MERHTKYETADQLAADLRQAGGDTRYRHAIRPLQYTEGAKALAESAGAYWLLDLVASYQPGRLNVPARLSDVKPGELVAHVAFQLWRLEVSEQSGIVTMREDTNEPALLEQAIPFTDFPPGTFEWYVVKEGITPVMLLKHEY